MSLSLLICISISLRNCPGSLFRSSLPSQVRDSPQFDMWCVVGAGSGADVAGGVGKGDGSDIAGVCRSGLGFQLENVSDDGLDGEDELGRLRVPSSGELLSGGWVEIGVMVGMLWVNWPQGFWGQVYWNLAAVLYGWKVGLVWLLCVSADYISGVLGVRFSGTLSVSVGRSGFCETEKMQCRNDRVGSYSHHHMDGHCQKEMVYWGGTGCGSRCCCVLSPPSLYV